MSSKTKNQLTGIFSLPRPQPLPDQRRLRCQHLRELETILGALRQLTSIKPLSLHSIAADDDLLRRLDTTVRALAATRKRPVRLLWEAYVYVCSRVPRLELRRVITRYLQTCVAALNASGEARRADTAFYKLQQLVRRRGKHHELAAELLTIIRRFVRREISAKRIRWEKYVPVLLPTGKAYMELQSGQRLPEGYEAVFCYTRFLEVIVEVRTGMFAEGLHQVIRWARNLGVSVRKRDTKHAEIVDIIRELAACDPYTSPRETVADAKSRHARAGNRRRKRNERLRRRSAPAAQSSAP